MNTFSAKSHWVLGTLTLLAVIGSLAVENGKVDARQPWYQEKLQAARLAQAAARHLKAVRLRDGVFVDPVNDPNGTTLIGQEYTLITTDHGNLDAKLATTNPNFAAVIVQMLKDAGLKKGDAVAVGMTGSFPGLNIATYAALQTLGLKPLVIASVGASNWGATDPYFTWLDMEQTLIEANIFRTHAIAASIGGGKDMGRGLSPAGRTLIRKAIARSGVEAILEKTIEKSIDHRLRVYREHSDGEPVKAYINIGGGVASLGSSVNGKLIKPGLSQRLPMMNYPVSGVIIEIAREDIPVIHLLNVDKIAAQYGLDEATGSVPLPGAGEIFVQKKYDVRLTLFVTIVLCAAILAVYRAERKRHRLGTERVAILRAGSDAAPANGAHSWPRPAAVAARMQSEKVIVANIEGDCAL